MGLIFSLVDWNNTALCVWYPWSWYHYVTRVKYFRSATQLRSIVCLKELPSSGRVSDFQRIFFGISRLCPMMPPRISSVCLPAFFLKTQLQFTCCLFSCLGHWCKQTATVSQSSVCLTILQSVSSSICFLYIYESGH